MIAAVIHSRCDCFTIIPKMAPGLVFAEIGLFMIEDDIAKHVGEITGHAGEAVAAWFALKGLGRLLGPTADLYGEEFRHIAAAGNRNLKRIFERAIDKVGEDLENDGQISPRLLHHLVEGAPYCEDEIAQDYFAGIIASSRIKNGSDYLIHYSALINRLPVSQIRLHYLFYNIVFECYKQYGLHMNKGDDRKKMPVVIPLELLLYLIRVAFQTDDEQDVDSMIAYHDDAINNMYTEELIGMHVYGNKSYFDDRFPQFKFDKDFLGGLLITRSVRGAELFLRAHGFKDKRLGKFFEVDLKKAIVGWFNVESRGVNNKVNYRFHLMLNEITRSQPELCITSDLSYDYAATIAIVEKIRNENHL